MSLAVLDIDGVVADVRHRLRFLDRRPKDWRGFFRASVDDPLIAEGAALSSELAGEHEIVWLTGRPEWLREVTQHWLDSHGLPSGRIFMRGNADRRPAALFKVGILRRLGADDVAAVVDDDPDVVATLRAAGFPAVLADWVPRADELAEAQDRLGRT